MEFINNEENDSNNINPNICNICYIQNGEKICQECPSRNIYYQNSNLFNSQLSSNRNFIFKNYYNQENNDNNDNENNQIEQDISSNRGINNKNNISNLETTFSQTFKTFKYEPLSYCPSQNSVLNNNNLIQTTKTNKSLNLNLYQNKGIKNDEKSLTYYNYDNDENNDDYNQIFKNENNKEEKIPVSPVVNNYIEQVRKIYEKERNK